MIDVEFRKNQYKSVTNRLEKMLTGKTLLRKVIWRAAKEASAHARKLTKKGIADATTLTPGDIGKTLEIYQKGSAIGMRIIDTAHPLSAFAFTPKKPKTGVNPVVEVYKGKKKKLVNGHYGASEAFVAEMKSGHVGIFERKTDEAKPINQFAGPAVTGIFKADEDVHNFVLDEMFETFEKRVEHHLEWFLKNG